MKKIHSLFIIIFFTFACVVTMVSFNYYLNNLMYFEDGKSSKQEVNQYNKDYIPSKPITNDSQDKMVKKSLEENLSTNDDITEKEKTSDDSNVNSSNEASMKNNENNDSLQNYYDYQEKAQSVFKVSTGKIQENLTTSDKIKLLYVSMQIGKEDYKKVEEYLYAEDAEDGVLSALKLLKEDLSKNEYEKVRKIAGKFIDMDAAERLY